MSPPNYSFQILAVQRSWNSNHRLN